MIRPIVLAAGLGSRLGSEKALLMIGGHPALRVVLDAIKSCDLASPVVVLGHGANQIRHSVDLQSCAVVINDCPETGMSGSLELGLNAAGISSEGVLVFHVDMPFIAPSTVRAVLDAAAEGATLAAPYYEGKRGFPVFFGSQHVDGLRRSLSGDTGGRTYLAEHDGNLVHVVVEDPGCVFDLDQPSDLLLWKGESLCAISE